jgi:hypothetical protein
VPAAGRAQLGFVLVLLLKCQHAAATAEFERAFALNPDFIDHRYAFVLTCVREPPRAIELLEASMRRDPFALPLYSSGYMGVQITCSKRHPEAVP